MPSVIYDTPTALPLRKPAPFVIGPTNKAPFRPTNKIPQDVIETAQATPIEEFEAKKHVNFEFPKRTYTMKEWGYENQGVSPIAASDPFSLFTEAAVKQVRRELLSEDVLRTCQYASTFTKNQIRGYTQKFITPHNNDSPEVQQAVSKVAGIDLVHAFEYEIGHCNLLFSDGEDEKKGASDNVGFSWHYDSFPFVCVTMLSDCSDMKGGETAVLKGDGEVLKVRGPSMGTAVILQGRYVQHAALKAIGKERISFITAFRPKSPFVKDEMVLTGSRPISNQSELVYDYCTYRADVLEIRFREHAKKLRELQAAGIKFNPDAVREFLQEQKEMLEATLLEMVPIYDVVEVEVASKHTHAMSDKAQSRINAIGKQLLPPINKVAPGSSTNSPLGIGRATAHQYAESGARALYLCDFDDTHLESHKKEINAAFPKVEIHTRRFDAADEDKVKEVVDDAIQRYGRLDVFFANAGVVGRTTLFSDFSKDEFMSILNTNTSSVFLAAKYAAPAMMQTSADKPQASGSIIGTASVAGIRSNAGSTPYSASKAAVVSLAQTISYQLAGTGVRMNAICPGLIETGMTAPVYEAARARGSEKKIGQLNPMKRGGHADEIARVALFLGSDESSYVNGQAWAVDGGLSAGHPFVPGKLG
ncbi:hypothetical protein FOXB_06149 [Fusarium oxysporum f. sp. conglutinans Fo5176]|uniref:Fe2OG dioxygenase domain-containing protein n=1 Tax=Fusarium oxysporum (strain Fo5176) TaxID=660025 RepID=F9FIC0_FUSOF|nr:hypothetical protein FOXB_06149 [Fusarium oxysporum f. sp. conglutinans Fo5176]